VASGINRPYGGDRQEYARAFQCPGPGIAQIEMAAAKYAVSLVVPNKSGRANAASEHQRSLSAGEVSMREGPVRGKTGTLSDSSGMMSTNNSR
jgi:hypothetical protein